MQLSQQVAQAKRLPIVLDPVGVGASQMRLQAAQAILARGVDLVKGNASEILQLEQGQTLGIGVDSQHQLEEVQAAALRLARKSQAMVIVTGAKDLVIAGSEQWRIDSPSAQAFWSGTGCVLGAILCLALTLEHSVEQLIHYLTLYRSVLVQSSDREALTRRLRERRAEFLR